MSKLVIDRVHCNEISDGWLDTEDELVIRVNGKTIWSCPEGISSGETKPVGEMIVFGLGADIHLELIEIDDTSPNDLLGETWIRADQLGGHVLHATGDGGNFEVQYTVSLGA